MGVGEEDTVQRFTKVFLTKSLFPFIILPNQKVIRLLKTVKDCRQILPLMLNKFEQIN